MVQAFKLIHVGTGASVISFCIDDCEVSLCSQFWFCCSSLSFPFLFTSDRLCRALYQCNAVSFNSCLLLPQLFLSLFAAYLTLSHHESWALKNLVLGLLKSVHFSRPKTECNLCLSSLLPRKELMLPARNCRKWSSAHLQLASKNTRTGKTAAFIIDTSQLLSSSTSTPNTSTNSCWQPLIDIPDGPAGRQLFSVLWRYPRCRQQRCRGDVPVLWGRLSVFCFHAHKGLSGRPTGLWLEFGALRESDSTRSPSIGSGSLVRRKLEV